MNYFNKKAKQISAIIVSAMLLASSTSCGIIEMRSSTTDGEEMVEDSTALMLTQAERYNTVETASPVVHVEQEEKTTEVRISLAGDIVVDDGIIADAANRASEGKSYSFMRMFTGIYSLTADSDISFASFSTAEHAQDSETSTPVECIAALAELGYDVLDTTGAAASADALGTYGVSDIDADTDECLAVIERDGVNFAFLTVNADSITADGGDIAEDMQYADLVSDVMIVSVNWSDDTEHDEKRADSAVLAALGADVIVGNSSVLGTAEWITADDGTQTLVAYSLGSLICSSDDYTELVGGVLEFTVRAGEGAIELVDVVLNPTVVYYSDGGVDYQLFTLEAYSDDLSESHDTEGLCADSMKQHVLDTVPAEFLPQSLKS